MKPELRFWIVAGGDELERRSVVNFLTLVVKVFVVVAVNVTDVVVDVAVVAN